MAVALDELKEQCAGLDSRQRADLAYFLLHTLEEADEEGVAEAWRAEARRRMADIRAGREVGKPADQVFAEAREKYP